jgi:Zn-dependent M32 family carboxypeptidase
VVLSWLRRHVHQRARLAEAPEIVRDAVGERDPVADLLDHLWSRHGALHGARRG